MATVFGISGLKSRLDDWRAERRDDAVRAKLAADSPTEPVNVAVEPSDDPNISLFLENLVIPRLMAGRAKPPKWISDERLVNARPAKWAITDRDVREFSRLALTADAPELLEFVDRCLVRGSSVETIYVELLAPAARKLGSYWEDDSEDFVEITMGLWRIQEILRELTLRIPPASRPGHGQRSALFSSMPGEQHSFGTLMVAECFERAGWDCDVLIEPTQSELTGKFAGRHYDVIGLTVSCDCPTGTLTSLITTIRAVSSNPGIRILIGGRVINERPDLVEQCGADATAVDAPSAVALAETLVPLRTEYFERLS